MPSPGFSCRWWNRRGLQLCPLLTSETEWRLHLLIRSPCRPGGLSGWESLNKPRLFNSIFFFFWKNGLLSVLGYGSRIIWIQGNGCLWVRMQLNHQMEVFSWATQLNSKGQLIVIIIPLTCVISETTRHGWVERNLGAEKRHSLWPWGQAQCGGVPTAVFRQSRERCWARRFLHSQWRLTLNAVQLFIRCLSADLSTEHY